MSITAAVTRALQLLRESVAAALPTLAEELRPPQAIRDGALDRPGSEQLRALWRLTGGQSLESPGVIGGLQLLGSEASEGERKSWLSLGVTGEGADAIVQPGWDNSTSLQPAAVRGVLFAVGWIPVLKEPMEANYLAVDTVPLSMGRAGQIILCGRDEDQKCVVAPDLVSLLLALAADAKDGNWLLVNPTSVHEARRVVRRRGRLLTACRDGLSMPD